MRVRPVSMAVGMALLVAACSGAPAATTEPALLPPFERDDLAAIFDPLVEPLGYRVTRGSLIDRTTYEVAPQGSHLALYIAPIDDIPPDRFASDFALLVPLLLPMVFERWPELNSFDVCQEPFSSSQDTPPSQTLIDLTREAAAEVQWSTIDLDGIIALDERTDISVWAGREVRDSETWRSAAAP